MFHQQAMDEEDPDIAAGSTSVSDSDSDSNRARLDASSALARLVLVVSVAVEVLFATIPMLLLFLDGDLPYIVHGITAWPRVVLLLLLSTLVHKKWYGQYRKIDAYMVYGLASAMAYAFAAYDKAQKEQRAMTAWQYHAVLVYAVLVNVLVGHLKVMAKWFPFTVRSVFAYKLTRVYHMLLCLIVTMVNSLEPLAAGATWGYYSITASLAGYLLSLVLGCERVVRDRARDAKKKKKDSKSGKHEPVADLIWFGAPGDAADGGSGDAGGGADVQILHH